MWAGMECGLNMGVNHWSAKHRRGLGILGLCVPYRSGVGGCLIAGRVWELE